MTHHHPDLERPDLRRAFRPAAASVWVVCSAWRGRPVGFTAISVVSVSITPPLVSFNIGLSSSSLDTLRRSGRWSAHLLRDDAESVARRFAASAHLRFVDEASWSWGTDGTPVVHGALSRLHGTVASIVPAGDSLVVLGAVDGADGADGRPLVHHDRTYRSLGAPADLALA